MNGRRGDEYPAAVTVTESHIRRGTEYMTQHVTIRVLTSSGFKPVVRLLFDGVPQVGQSVEFDGETMIVTGVSWLQDSNGAYRPEVTLR